MLKRIETKDLRLGMFVVDVGRGWLRHPWRTKSKLLRRQKEIDQLLDYGITEVTVDTIKSEYDFSEPPKPEPYPHLRLNPLKLEFHPAPSAPGQAGPVSAVELELPRAAKAYDRALDTSRALLAACRMNKKIEVEAVEENVNELVESVNRNPDALMALMKLRYFDDYTFTHSLNVSVLAISTGKSLGLDETDLMNLGLGAMFHDLGKSRIPNHILNKPGQLTEEEFAIMREHAAMGGEIIQEQHFDVDDIVYKIARNHHERFDGSGYPDNLRAEAIPHLVTICGLSDIYDAMSSDRVYHKALPLHEALQNIYSLRGSQFPDKWVDRFVHSVGIYPSGTIVQLNSLQVAVVMEANADLPQTPLIKIIADPAGVIYARPHLLDLSQKAQAKGLRIKRVLPRNEAGFEPSDYFNPPKE